MVIRYEENRHIKGNINHLIKGPGLKNEYLSQLPLLLIKTTRESFLAEVGNFYELNKICNYFSSLDIVEQWLVEESLEFEPCLPFVSSVPLLKKKSNRLQSYNVFERIKACTVPSISYNKYSRYILYREKQIGKHQTTENPTRDTIFCKSKFSLKIYKVDWD